MDSTATISDRIGNAILRTCRQVDPNVKVSACGRDHVGRTIVQMTASATHTATELASALRTLMPLALVKTKQDLMSGEIVAHVTVPTAEDEWDIAHLQARSYFCARLLRWSAAALLLLGTGAWLALSVSTAEPRDI